jgi:hypothetical protein
MHQRRSKGLIPRGDGSRGPRSSCAPQRCTNGKSCPNPSVGAACSVFAAATGQALFLRPVFILVSVVVILLSCVLTTSYAAKQTSKLLFTSFAAVVRLLFKIVRSAPFRSLFLIFLFSGVNLEANVSISAEQTPRAVERARTIAHLPPAEYTELLTTNIKALEQLSIISSCEVHDAKKLNDSYVRVWLRCTAQCGQERGPKLRCSQKCPTVAQAAEFVLEHVLKFHAGCIEAQGQEQCNGCACTSGDCGSSSASQNVFSRLFQGARQLKEKRAADLQVSSALAELRDSTSRAGAARAEVAEAKRFCASLCPYTLKRELFAMAISIKKIGLKTSKN